MAKTLYLFTKQFPYGSAEAYISAELDVLNTYFDSIYLIPAEYFSAGDTPHRAIPDRTKVLHLNEKMKVFKGKLSLQKKCDLFFSIFIQEVFTCGKPLHFLLNMKRFWGMLNYQALCAEYFKKELQVSAGNTNYFYSYWCHNSCVMLGLLKNDIHIPNYITRGHSLDLYHNHWVGTAKGLLAFRDFKFKTASKIFTVSKAGLHFMHTTYPSFKGKTECAYLGVNDSGINPYFEGDEFCIVSCSTVTANKRIPFIAETLKQVQCKVKWVHFGEGPEKQNVLDQTKNLPPHIQFEYRGQVPNETVLQFYKTNTVHLFINMSEAEGIPVSMMEAISFGIPVMATDVYGNPEIANEHTGFQIPLSASANEIALRIDIFASNALEQKRLRTSARNYFIEHFEARKNYKAFIEKIISYPG